MQRTMRVTKKEAEAELNRIEADLAKSPAEKAAEMTVRELCRLFLEEHSVAKLRPTTIKNYRIFFKHDLVPECGEVPLGTLDRNVLQRVIKRMIERGLAPRTIETRHGYMNGLFSWGVDAKYLPDTPVKNLSLPEDLQESVGQTLSRLEVKEVLAVFEDTPYWLPIFLAIHTGMRPGEVLGLSWDDVDLDGARLYVRHTIHWEADVLRLGPPKTKSSRRSVGVSEGVVAILKQREQRKPESFWRRRRRGSGIVPAELSQETGSTVSREFRQVCAQPDGIILNTGSWRQFFRSELQRAQLKRIRPHDLRHTHASLMLLGGVPIHVVSERLGHADISTTIKLYGHLLPTSDHEAAAKFSTILSMDS